ncbi:MAG TPA: cupin domain-containing protein, partial [Chloroflexia bacterium]|nr:cupin domain-containing protein [Chloroflexia bacterium]
VRLGALYPATGAGGSLVAVDLLEVEPEGSTPLMQAAEEHILYILSGAGEVQGGEGGSVGLVRAGSVVRIAPREAHTLKAQGRETLRVLVVTPLLALSDRALGIKSTPEVSHATEKPTDLPRIAERPATATDNAPSPRPVRPPQPTPVSGDEDDEARPDISGLMRKASELAGQPKPERRRPAPEPEPEPQPAPVEEEADEEVDEVQKELMELLVVVHGATRGTPGQGYGAYSVQSPGRKAVIKRAEFGPNFTTAQAEYDTLLAGLEYIIERLTVTNRTPIQVGLDIRNDSDSLVNQLLGHYKVKDAGLRSRHAQAMELLEQFGAWQIEWQSTEETVKALGLER